MSTEDKINNNWKVSEVHYQFSYVRFFYPSTSLFSISAANFRSSKIKTEKNSRMFSIPWTKYWFELHISRYEGFIECDGWYDQVKSTASSTLVCFWSESFRSWVSFVLASSRTQSRLPPLLHFSLISEIISRCPPLETIW